jgi:carboxypeptidase Taq
MQHSPYRLLVAAVQQCRLLDSCGAVLGWDERTYMPRKGSAHRGEQMALLAKLAHEMLTSPRIGEWLAEASSASQAEGESPELANLREIRRGYERACKLPADLVEELARTTTQAQQVWDLARRDDDFPAFEPWLKKIIQLKRREAAAIGYSHTPYDALLEEYEPGATTAEIETVFGDLRRDLVALLERILGSGKRPNAAILKRDFPVDRQVIFGQAAAAAIGFDFSAGRLDVTSHPFCSTAGPGDVRLTTRYNPRHFSDGFFSILHEAGHGIYEQGLPAEHFGTPCGTAASMGIHESQSRLWENQVGRSRVFWEHFFPRARQTFVGALDDVKLDDFVFAINDVQPSFIRVEADEATYNLHIILRFELEQALIRGDLEAGDVPDAWNEKFHAYFGLRPPSQREGCLQDIHWSFGGFGYFPTYTLGNLYAAQFMNQARIELPGLEHAMRQGDFSGLKGWLNQRIHFHGQRWRAADLCRRVTGAGFSHKPLIAYLTGKYTELFGL